MQSAQQTHDESKGTARLEAFSDGVFAIAITLLALELQIPHVEPNSAKWALASALLNEWPSYVAFVTSFFTVLIMWMNHHAVFKFVRKVNARILFGISESSGSEDRLCRLHRILRADRVLLRSLVACNH